MSRPLDANTSSHLGDQSLNVVYILRMDIPIDPVTVWSAWGQKTFTAGQTGDAALDGQTFDGVTHMIGEISAAQDEVGGSQSLELTMPGVDINSDLLRQVVRDKRQWQFRQAWLWMAFVDGNLNILGKPFRLKTGRMDQMVLSEDQSGVGSVKAVVEGQQAYASEALNTRYSETKDLDPADISNDFAAALANMVPTIGQKHSGSTTGGEGAASRFGGRVVNV